VSLKRWLGVDAVGLAIHATLTVCAIGFFMSQPGVHEERILFLGTGASVLLLAVNRAIVRWRSRPDDVPEPRLEELEHRLSELDGLQIRVMELEERLDFAERLLTEQHASPQQIAGTHPR